MHSMNGYVISNFVRPQRSKVGSDSRDLLPQLFQNTTNILSLRLLLWLFLLLIRLNLNFMVLDYLGEGGILLLCPTSSRDFSEFVGDLGESKGHLASQLMHTVVQRSGYEPRSTIAVENVWMYNSTTPDPIMACTQALLHFKRSTNS